MNNYSDFFNDDPWESIELDSYPAGRQLYLNDDRYWVSMDNEGRRMFFVHEPQKTNCAPLGQLNSLNISLDEQYPSASRLCCTLVDNDLDIINKFTIVAKDIAFSCSQYTGTELMVKVQARLKSWANFLKPIRNGLSDSTFTGFWGELYVMSQYMMKNSIVNDAMRFWIGPEGKKQDFTLNNVAVEVKTTMSGEPRSIKISSIDQLERVTKKLYLFNLIISPATQGKGLSLKDMFDYCMEEMKNDIECQTKFLHKVSELYDKASEEQLNNPMSVVAENLYDVQDDFPALTSENLPLAIPKVQYEILINSLQKYKSTLSIEEVINNG